MDELGKVTDAATRLELKWGMIHPPFKVLFVCMGNICRSPTAEGVFRQKALQHRLGDRLEIDSAGTHNFHPNSPPDPRSQAHALRRGYDLSQLKARAVTPHDFEHFDLLLTMDWDNRALLEERCPAQFRHKIKGFAEFLSVSTATVIADPYYSEEEGFEQVLDLIEEASSGLLEFVQKRALQHE